MHARTEQLLGRLDGVRANGSGWKGRCPAHPDRTPSLSITETDDRILVHCHAGCAKEDVVAAVHLTMADLFFDRQERSERPREVATYPYTDADGELLYEVIRYEPKTFRQRAADGSWSVRNVPKVLYRLPEVIAAVAAGERVYVVEGEKDADALARAGCYATCNAGGAGKFSSVTEAAEVLTGAHLVIVADTDAPGRAHARQVRDTLAPVAASIEVVQAAVGKDAADHLGAGRGVDDFEPVDLDDDQDDDEPDAADEPTGLELIDWTTVHDIPESIIDGFAIPGRWTAIAAKPKAGKSTLLVYVTVEVSLGRDPWTGDQLAEPVRVLYLDGEMGRLDLEQRVQDCGHEPDKLTHWHACDLLPKLDTIEGAARLLSTVDALGVELIAIDGLNSVISGDENDNRGWLDLYEGCIAELKRRGVAVVTADNLGKDTTRGPRGHSVKMDKADAIVNLIRTDTGARLNTSHRRTAAYPESLDLNAEGVHDDDPRTVRYRRSSRPGWPAGTSEKAVELDQLGAPRSITKREARKLLEEHGRTAGRDVVLRAAIRYRQERPPEGSGSTPGSTLSDPLGFHFGSQPPETPSDQEGSTSGSNGSHPAEGSGSTGSPLGGARNPPERSDPIPVTTRRVL